MRLHKYKTTDEALAINNSVSQPKLHDIIDQNGPKIKKNKSDLLAENSTIVGCDN